MSFGLYLAGAVIVMAGVLYMAHLMHLPQHWIVALGLIIFGMAVVGGVQNTRQKDPS